MDNARLLSGYKAYLEPGSGERPAVFVAFLDLRPEPGTTVNGVLFPAGTEELRALDRRERNYRRVEVTEAVRPAPSGRAWTYVGSAAGCRRLEAGLAAGTAVVSRAYRDEVERGFRTLGEAEWQRYAESTDPPPCPVRELERVDLD
jgi:hypothetical protein